MNDEQDKPAADNAPADETEMEDLEQTADMEQAVDSDPRDKEIASLKDEVLRARAELENMRKRAERDVEAAHKYGLERLVQELLPVKDSMDLGLDAAASASEIESLIEGMSLTAKMFADFFEKLNIEMLDPAGERFDPEFHQAMTTEESAEHDPGTVVRVMQKGYRLNERLVRPALVVVSKAVSEDNA